MELYKYVEEERIDVQVSLADLERWLDEIEDARRRALTFLELLESAKGDEPICKVLERSKAELEAFESCALWGEATIMSRLRWRK